MITKEKFYKKRMTMRFYRKLISMNSGIFPPGIGWWISDGCIIVWCPEGYNIRVPATFCGAKVKVVIKPVEIENYSDVYQ